MIADISIQDWLDASEVAAKELVTMTLGYEEFEILQEKMGEEEIKCGSYVEMISDEIKVTVGIVTNRMGSQKITESLLGMEPMSEEDEADSLGEVANILAGSIKTKMSEHIKNMQLGLPFFFKGKIHFKEPVEVTSSSEKWGGIPVMVMVIQRKDK